MDLTERQRWMLTGTLVALVAGIVVRTLLAHQWSKVTERSPPRDVVSPDTGWIEALAWTALTSLAGGLASMLARRLAAGLWRLGSGTDPRRA